MNESATDTSNDDSDWTAVDRGWGHRAVDFATLSEPANCREYAAVHHRLRVDVGDRLLDVACGAGLAVELARGRGAACAGIDASARLVAVARDRNPESDIRVGDMHALPWDDATFDVVTSFRGVWGTTPEAIGEIHRVLVDGGRIGITVWGHIKNSPGAWALAPFSMAAAPKVSNQAAMVALGRPGAGEELLERYGFESVERITVPFVWEFADPETFARAVASTGPAYEAIEHVGEEAFIDFAVAHGSERVRLGLPLRASIDVVGYVAVKPMSAKRATLTNTSDHIKEPTANAVRDADSSRPHYLNDPVHTPEAQALFDTDIHDAGYVMNASRLWAYQPAAIAELFDLLKATTVAGALTLRQRGVLVTATASTIGDSYCSLSWGSKLADAADADIAAGVICGGDDRLTAPEKAMARWARSIAKHPNNTTPDDIEALRDVGFSDEQIFAMTVFVSLRIAFSTVNAALGAHPDAALGSTVPDAVLDAVTYGRPIQASPTVP